MYIDTHAHLYAAPFDTDRHVMVERAIAAGVNALFLPNIDSRSIQGMYDLVAAFPQNCFAMMGVHPCSIKDNFETELAIAAKELEQASTKFYAVGEIGLDYYWDTTHKAQQQQALRTQIGWAKKYQLPIVLHCRESFDDTYSIVQELNDENLTGIFHCFSGTLAEAHKIMELGGFYMGIGGSLTHKKAHALRETVAQIPLEYLLLETDAPYLAPEPFRSAKKRALKRNESAHITYVAQKMADIKQCPLNEVATFTTRNARNVFKYQV